MKWLLLILIPVTFFFGSVCALTYGGKSAGHGLPIALRNFEENNAETAAHEPLRFDSRSDVSLYKRSSHSDSHRKRFNLTVTGCILLPIGKMSKFSRVGTGAVVSATIRNTYGLGFGFESGYQFFFGKEDRNYLVTVPLMGKAEYCFKIDKNVSLVPAVSLGYHFNSIHNFSRSTSGFFKWWSGCWTFSGLR
jgi:hypothetical protein